MSNFDLTVFNRIAMQQKETNDLLRELIKQLKDQKTYLPKFGEVRPSPPPVFSPYVPAFPGNPWQPPATVWCNSTQIDPCPSCVPNTVCRTPNCGRLKAKDEKRS